MTVQNLFTFINATAFFPAHCPNITSWKHKLRGMNGRGNPVAFTDQELDQIQRGIERISKSFASTTATTKMRTKLAREKKNPGNLDVSK